ncbi:MAG: ABC transporter ATP-binding protein [Clostridiales Family XIII bacterium]|jgi:branched-chain amino acid transport system ATP-binding protein|nr:ABC transporter ATP-binding protein [Clostridiales Family XIII bacterium]
MLLQLENVTRYFGGLAAVKDVSFGIQEGQILGLIGPNGSGKTTCFNLITGLYHPSEGQISFNGEVISKMPPHVIARKGVARSFQISSVFPTLAVIENVVTAHYCRQKSNLITGLLGIAGTRKEEKQVREHSGELLEFVGLGDKAHAEASALTSADQRRLMIAIALATEPKLLMLDEPCAGMTDEEQTAIVALMRKICGDGIPILLVEHHMKIVMEVSNHIVVLDRGEKIAEGQPEEIKNNDAVIEAYLGRSEKERA